MRHLEGTFNGTGGIELFHQCWLPEGTTNAVLVIAHGYGEHSSRYDNLVEYFVPLGYAIYALDHRGHGRSGGERVQVDDFNDYVADLRTFFQQVRSQTDEIPITLLGHSMGSFIAIGYAALYQNELAVLMLSGGGMGRKRSGSSQTRKQVDLAVTVSKDPAVVQAYRDDPLVYHGSPPPGRNDALRPFFESLPQLVKSISLPVLIMAGAASPLGDADGSRALFDQVSSEDKTLQVYEGLMHEIFNEPERDQVFANMQAWLKERVG